MVTTEDGRVSITLPSLFYQLIDFCKLHVALINKREKLKFIEHSIVDCSRALLKLMKHSFLKDVISEIHPLTSL